MTWIFRVLCHSFLATTLYLIVYEIGSFLFDVSASRHSSYVMAILRLLALLLFHWITYQRIAAVYDAVILQEAEQPRFTEQSRLSAFISLSEHLINDPLTDRVDATCDNLFGLYYALKHQFPEATFWKLTTHSAHGFYFNLSFQYLAQEVKIGVMHDQDAHEKRFFFSNVYSEKPAEVISAVVSHIGQ